MAGLERLGIDLPVVQAGMGGGVAGHELAVAVSSAGGLGTIAVHGPHAIRRELAAARVLTDKPLAVNVLLPFATRAWFEAASSADVVVTFWGRPRRHTPRTWWHQCGSVDEIRAAQAAGADGVIVQGVEAGGHVRGTTPALRLLERTRVAVGPDYPVLVAGGIAERADVQTALSLGASAAVAGTRFLLTPESGAHPAYKERLLQAETTILTELFGLAWPRAPHRVVPNEATRRGLRPDGSVPAANRLVNRLTGLDARHTPSRVVAALIARQHPGGRLLTPQSPTRDLPTSFVEAGPLYAGETVRRIDALMSAGDAVALLTP